MSDDDRGKVEKVVADARRSIDKELFETVRQELPFMADRYEMLGKAMFIKFNALRKCGFTEEQALKIIAQNPY